MKLKKLAMILDTLRPHPEPTPKLEQYTLLGEDAALFLWTARYDLEDSVVVDLGCGSGRLAIGSALLGASFVVGVDVDLKALKVAKDNALKAGVSHLTSWLLAKVPYLKVKADVVIQNPPFGVQRKGADRDFIECALNLAPIVYSMHKSVEGGRSFISRTVRSLGGTIELLNTVEIRIPALFHYHEKKFKKVKVDIYRFRRANI